jgi:hypothetical protein
MAARTKKMLKFSMWATDNHFGGIPCGGTIPQALKTPAIDLSAAKIYVLDLRIPVSLTGGFFK